MWQPTNCPMEACPTWFPMYWAREPRAQQARETARSWWKKLPQTLDRYLSDESLIPYRAGLRPHILSAIEVRLVALGLLLQPQADPNR